MIYLFDESKTLTGTVRDEHVRSLLYDREKNGMYDISAEIPVIAYHQGNRYNLHTATKNAVFLGHYDLEGRFQLHKIAGYDVNSDTIAILGVHIFFDEAKAGAIIQDRRYIDREISDGARDAFAEIGWHLADYDVSPRRNYNFYNVSPLEARATLIETFGFEFDYWIDFDGKKISGKYFSVKKQIGQDVGKRYTYDKHTNTGHHVLELTAETDYSEVYTAVIGRGRGEEIEETGGFGRRIEYTDIEWTKPNRPLNKPRGSRVLIDPEATQAFGYVQEDGTITPRTAVVIFSDIEEQSELLEASYDWLVEHRQPKLVFDVNVADGDGLELGDTVYIKYNEINLNMAVRVGKVIDDLKSGERQVQLGDVAYFKPGRSNRDIKRSIRQERRDANSRIYQLKLEFDERFDNEVQQMWDDYEQALIDAHAEIQAAEQRMEALINTTRNDWTDTFNAEVAEIYRKADEDYNRIETEITGVINSTREEMEDAFNLEVQAAKDLAEQRIADAEQRINTTIDTTRNEMEQGYNQAVISAREYAEQQAQEKAAAVRTDLETVTDGHQSILDNLESNVMNIDDFLGDISSITLDERLQNINRNFEERIRNVDSNTYNMMRETRFDNTDFVGWSGGTIYNDESIPYFKNNNFSVTAPWVSPNESVTLESGKEYILSFDFRSESVPEADYVWFIARDGGNDRNFLNDSIENTLYNIPTNGNWTRVYIRFTAWRGATGRVRIGTRFNVANTDVGEFSIRLPYLTSSSNKEWVYHPLDATQSIEEVTRRITNLEDGRNELITRTEWDSESDHIMQMVRDIEETVDTSRSLIQEIENYEIIQRGSEAIQTVDGFLDKVWLNDFSEIGANLIPQSSNAWENGTFWSGGTNNNNSGGIRTKDYIEVIPGERYTFQDESLYVSAIQEVQIAQWDGDTRIGITAFVNRRNSRSFTAQGDRIRIGLTPMSGFGILPRYIDNPDGRIKMKLEKGDSATPFMNALSRVEQLADSFSVQVAELDGDYLKQSELEITPEYAQIGSMRIDGDTVGSMLRVSPNGIDAVAEAMRLSGDLYVDGDITALAISAVEGNFASLIVSNLETNKLRARHINANAIGSDHLYVTNAMIEKLIANSVLTDEMTARSIDAIEGNFARLWATEFSAITIDADDINGLTARFEWLYTLNANIERLVSQNVFTRSVDARVGNFVDVNAGNIVTSGLSANVIKTSHLDADTTMVRKLFATSARIDQLITRNHYVDNVKALSLDVVYANISDLRTELLTSNVITSNHIKVENALIDKMFASTALVGRLTSKSAFIRDIQAIEITANQLNLTTLRNRFNQIEGGLHIRRTDHYVSNGVEYGMYIQNGIPNMDVDVQRNQFMHNDVVGWTGQRYQMSGRNMSNNQMYNMETIYTSHKSKYITVGFGLTVSGTASAYVVFELVEFSSGNSLGRRRVFVTSGGVDWNSVTVNLGVPDYNSPKSFYLRAGIEQVYNATYLQVVVNRVNMHG